MPSRRARILSCNYGLAFQLAKLTAEPIFSAACRDKEHAFSRRAPDETKTDRLGTFSTACCNDPSAVADTPGVYLERLLSRIAAGGGMPQQALDELTGMARAMAACPSALSPYLAGWDPVVAGLVAEARRDGEAAAAVKKYLAQYESSDATPMVVGALRRIGAGERRPTLAAGNRRSRCHLSCD